MVLQRFRQQFGLIESVCSQGLFVEELEQLFDDRLVDFRRVNQEVAKFFQVTEFHLVTRMGDVGPGCIDRFSGLFGPESPNRIVVFKDESQGVDDAMAGLAHGS